jgi:hypothetical protein
LSYSFNILWIWRVKYHNIYSFYRPIDRHGRSWPGSQTPRIALPTCWRIVFPNIARRLDASSTEPHDRRTVYVWIIQLMQYFDLPSHYHIVVRDANASRFRHSVKWVKFTEGLMHSLLLNEHVFFSIYNTEPILFMRCVIVFFGLFCFYVTRMSNMLSRCVLFIFLYC